MRDGVPLVAVVGRANVGKSTLVNRLLGRREAIEHAEPGVTRDRRAYRVEWGGRRFDVVDTGGWEPRARGLQGKVAAQARRAVAEADVIVFVVDAEVGITDDDLAVGRILRRAAPPVLVAANKVDSAKREPDAAAFVRLGFGEAFPVSALHGRGSGELMDALVAALPEKVPAGTDRDEIRVAIAGRPNVGKSSLLNRLANDERSIVDEIPGTTRDTVDTVVEIESHRYRFVDTAGIRKRARQAQGPEYYGLVRSLHAIEEAEVVLLVLDAIQGAGEQDQKIARRVVDAGRALVLVLNKWDLVEADEVERVEEALLRPLRFVAWAPVVRASAKTGRGMARLLPLIERARGSWEKRVATAEINVWLREAAERVRPGARGGRPAKVRYATQARTRPPEVVLFSTAEISETARRTYERLLRERFGFEGTPVRITVRKRQARA